MLINFGFSYVVPGGPLDAIEARLEGSGDSLSALAGATDTQEAPGRNPAPPRPGKRLHRLARALARDARQARGAVRLRPHRLRRRLHRHARPQACRMPEGGDPLLGTLRHHDVELPALRLRRKLLPRHRRGRPRAGEDARLHHAGPVVHPDRLPHLHPARHPQGRARRHRLRHLVLRHHHRGLCDPGLPLRRAPHGRLRGRLLLPVVPAARPHLGELGGTVALGQDRRLPLAHHPAGDGAAHRLLRHPHAPDQELLPGRDQEALRHDRPRQGPVGTARPLRPRLPQRHAHRHRGLPGPLPRRLLRLLPHHRDDLLARWAGAPPIPRRSTATMR